MNRNTYLALLAAVSIPFAAVAQEQTQQDPVEQTEELLEEQGGDQASDRTNSAENGMEQTADTDEIMSGDDGSDAALAAADAVEGPFVTVPQSGAWRVTDLEGKNVEDANGEDIGDISDVLVNQEGEVIAVLVGVGGFLGIGEKDVAVSMSALEFGPGKTEGLKTVRQKQEEEAAAQAQAQTELPDAGTTGTGTTGTMTGSETMVGMQPTADEPVVGSDNLPDRIVLNVTREELEAAPAYEDVAEGIDDTMTSDVPLETEEPKPAE